MFRRGEHPGPGWRIRRLVHDPIVCRDRQRRLHQHHRLHGPRSDVKCVESAVVTAHVARPGGSHRRVMRCHRNGWRVGNSVNWRPWGSPPEPEPPRAEPTQRRRKRVILKAVRPNLGIEVAYRRALERLVATLHGDVTREVRDAYAVTVAQDATPASYLSAVMRRLRSDWQGRMDTGARELAAYFATSVQRRTDAQLRAILKRAGYTVPLTMTDAVRDALEAAVAENVTLIKSIGSQYLDQVEGHVMRSASVGPDLASLSQSLQAQFGVTKRRAAFIAKDQSNKATSVIVRERQNQFGLKAIWLHSGGGKTARATH